MTDDPVTGVERAVGLVEDVARRRGEQPRSDDRGHYRRRVDVGFPLLERGADEVLFYSTDVAKLRELHPEVEVLNRLGAETRVVVSEPLRDLSGAWNEVPESSCGIVRPGADEIAIRSGLRVRPFRLAAPQRGHISGPLQHLLAFGAAQAPADFPGRVVDRAVNQAVPGQPALLARCHESDLERRLVARQPDEALELRDAHLFGLLVDHLVARSPVPVGKVHEANTSWLCGSEHGTVSTLKVSSTVGDSPSRQPRGRP